MFPFQREPEEEEFPEDRLSWTEQLVIDLRLREQLDGGYSAETDRSHLSIPTPLPTTGGDTLDGMRPTSSSTYFLLNKARPSGFFHRNQSRTIHSIHEGAGIYLVLYPPSHPTGKTANIQELYMATRGRREVTDGFMGYERRRLSNGYTLEKFGVGRRFGIYQWLIESNVYKSSFLIDYDSSFGYIEPERKEVNESERRDGMFITEVVAPGFDFADHESMKKDTFAEIFNTPELRAEFRSLLKP